MKHRYNVKRLVKNLLFSAALGFIMMPNLSYSQQVTYSFATCGVTGSVGPTQAQVNTFYATSNLNGSVTISGQGIQQFTVPDRKSTRLNSSHVKRSRMPSSA